MPLPELHTQELIREEHLPGRLKEKGVRLQNVLIKLISNHPLPRIELEEETNGIIVQVNELIRD